MKPSSSRSDGLFDGILARGGVPAAVSDDAWLAAMLSVEAALALECASAGVIPAGAAAAIAAACSGLDVDPGQLGRDAAKHGSPVVPLVAAIRTALPDDVTAHV